MYRSLHHICRMLQLAVTAWLLLVLIPTASCAQTQGETFQATASLKNPAGAQVTAPVTIVVNRPTSDAERAAVADALKKGATSGAVQSLNGMPDAGYIEIGGRRTPVKYAYVRPTGTGRLVTVVAPAPIVHLGAGLPDAKPKAGFDLAIAILDLTASGTGTGELVPAASVKLDGAGAIQTQDYGAEAVRLTNVQAKK